MEIENFVLVIDDFMPSCFCEKAIKYFNDMKDRGVTFNRQMIGEKLAHHIDDVGVNLVQENVIELTQTKSIVSEFDKKFWQVAYPAYFSKYSILSDSGSHSIQNYKIQKTEIGGGFHSWHYESSSKYVSNRLMAFILYLDDVDEGGETEFLYFPKRIKAKKGRFVLFPAAYTHTHRGNPPISNSKHIMTGWVEF